MLRFVRRQVLNRLNNWFGLTVGGHPALSLHSSNEPGELSQWLCHDDSTINIVSNIIIIIIIIIIIYETYISCRLSRSQLVENADLHLYLTLHNKF